MGLGPQGMRAISAVLLGFISGVFSTGWAQMPEEPQFRPAPGWVETQALPAILEKTPDGTADGRHYILSDTQYRVTAVETYRYGHLAYRIADRAGLETGGRLSFEFDPSDTELIIHRISIIRDGEVLDRLDRDRFTTIRRETDLQSGIVDGNLTSFIELRDVRVGDLVAYEYGYRTRSELWPGGLSAQMPMQWSIPIERRTVRILAPSDMPLSIAGSAELDPVVTHENGWADYRWQLDQPERLAGEASIANGYAFWDDLSVSNMPDWAAVVEWGLPHYTLAGALPASAQAVIDRVRADYALDRDRITALIRYVQDDIRYVSDATGLGSHVPRDPETVIANGYGDCKDKALLLVSLLRAIGVPADVAFTDIDEGMGLPDLAPSPYAFDHAIVRIEFEGQTVWIDATASLQGGRFPQVMTAPYGYALPLREGQAGLEYMPIENSTQPALHVEEVFDLADYSEDGISLAVISTYRDRQADSFRVNLASRSRVALSEDYLSYYQNHYPGITVSGELEVEDDRDANLITVREFYDISAEALETHELPANFVLRGDAVLNRISAVEAGNRTAPIHLPWPLHQTHEHRLINTPIPLSGLPPVELETPFARYQTQTRSTASTLVSTYTLQTLADRAPADAVDDYNALVRSIEDTADLWIGFDFEDGLWSTFQLWLLQPGNDMLFGYGLAAGMYLLALLGAILAFRRDSKMPEGAVFFPVSAVKFVVLSFFTFNLYALLWMWRNWRWIKRHDEASLSPFMRSFFSVFFYPAQAVRIEEEAETSGASRALAVAAGGLFSIASLASGLADRIPFPGADEPLAVTTLLIVGNLLCLPMLPALFRVNSLNRANPQVQAYNSRWNIRTVIFLLYGAGFLALSLVGAQVPA